MLIGCHLSAAGGPHNALLKAAEMNLPAVALFVRNQRRWQSPPLSDEQVKLFVSLRRKLKLARVIAHGSYLLNLGGEPEIRYRSIAALADEYDRCGRLGVDALVIHPGSSDELARGIELIAAGIRQVLSAAPRYRTKILVETTAGGGRQIGGRFEELAAILALAGRGGKCGVCLDTCHVFAAGYDVRSPEAYAATMEQFDAVVGLKRLLAVHMNDSLGRLGARRDRHAHVGAGQIGREGLANFVNDSRLADVPIILETPKGTDPRTGEDYDVMNVRAANELVGRGATPAPARRAGGRRRRGVQ